MVSPEAVAEAVRVYAEETNRQNHERRAEAEVDRRPLEKIERGIKGILAAIEDGMYQPGMKARMSELEQQKAAIEARFRGAVEAVLRGELMGILDLVAGQRRSPRPEVITNALANPRNHPKPKPLKKPIYCGDRQRPILERPARRT
jgi:hypothetical protein